MNRFQAIGRAISRVALATLAWGIAQSPVLAAANPQIPAESGNANPYLFPYCVVLLCVSLGLAAAYHSSRRSDRPKFMALAEAAAMRKAKTGEKD
jgi:hypothetical protein